ncbi:MAG: methionine--tRNA ligase [Phycisphaerae bacterium]|nr:methionine--tRNA ligase [Phycisphaerae bacterium]
MKRHSTSHPHATRLDPLRIEISPGSSTTTIHAMTARKTAYITTPIYYVNDRPHIGHAYTTTLCDVWARAMRFEGRDVFFLTGTDEHGVKVEKSARERGISPQALADENAAEFQRVLEVFGLTNDDFIRTTQPRHVRQVQEMVRRLLAADAIYAGEFEGWYDEGQEEYVTENRARETDFKSPISGRPLVKATEKNYYFRLSAFQDRLEALFTENPGFVRPDARRNEVLGRLREGLQDVPITRTNFEWGIPFPGDEEHVIYVWIDALLNYATGLGLAEDDSETNDQRRYWPADLHVIGKEILWFHAVIWPAVLMALELPIPRCIYAHSFWISEGQKMSKSLGNFIDLPTIERYMETYGLDAWRWYMVVQGPLGATDADFQATGFHETYTSDLVNTVGNCASRTTAMIGKYFDGVVPADSGFEFPGWDLPAASNKAVEAWRTAMENFALADACEAGIGLLRTVDAFINATAPFKVAKDETRREELRAILARCVEAVRIASMLLTPILPERMQQLRDALAIELDVTNGGLDDQVTWSDRLAGSTVQKVALFPRVDAPAEEVVS